MARPVLLFAASGAFTTLVLAYAAFAWVETETRVLAAAAAEGRAVLGAVAAGVQSSLDANTAVEYVLTRRLVDLAAQLDKQLADEVDDLDSPLREFVTSHRLRGAVVLDSSMQVRASASAKRGSYRNDGAFDEARIARAEAERLAQRLREHRWVMSGHVSHTSFGFGESPFSERPEYLVADLAPNLKGYVLLRHDAADLEQLQAKAGVAKLLASAAHSPGIAYLLVQAQDGRVLAANDASRVGETMPAPGLQPEWRSTGAGRVFDVSLPLGDDRLRVGLAAAPVEDLITRGRRNVALFTLMSLAAGAAVVVLLVRRVRRLAELDERERFASMGRLAAGVAHEIRSPLNALSMAAQRLQREAAPSAEPQRAKFAELTTALRGGIARLDGTVREFLSLGQSGPPPEFAAIHVAKLVEEVVAAEGADVGVDAPAAAVVARGDRALLAKALGNLVRNAHQIAPGTVRIAWRATGEETVIEVRDGGPGIAAEDRSRVFEPFFSKRPGGTGLGLAIAKDAVERQGGRIEVTAAEGGGARFAIRLPAEDS